jgi:hypothetical protein
MADNEIRSLEERNTARSFRNIHNKLRRKIEDEIRKIATDKNFTTVP